MCEAKNITSTFRFLGNKYKIYLKEKNDKTYPVIDRKVFSFLGFSFWKTEVVGHKHNLSNKEVKKLEDKGTLAVVKWLKSFARSQNMINA